MIYDADALTGRVEIEKRTERSLCQYEGRKERLQFAE
jgi:hypothetical protein